MAEAPKIPKTPKDEEPVVSVLSTLSDNITDVRMEAALAGKLFLTTTTGAARPSEMLELLLLNPAGSGKRLLVLERWFDNDAMSRGEPARYKAFGATPDAEGRTPVRISRMNGESDVDSVGVAQTFKGGSWGDGGPGTAASLPVGGRRLIIDLPYVLPPGKGVGYRIYPSGGDTLLEASISIVFAEID